MWAAVLAVVPPVFPLLHGIVVTDVLELADRFLIIFGAAVVVAGVSRWVRARCASVLVSHVPPNRISPEAVLAPLLVWLLTATILAEAVQRWVVEDRRDVSMIWCGNVAQLFGAMACLVVARRVVDGGAGRFLLGDISAMRSAALGGVYLLASLAICWAVLNLTLLSITAWFPGYEVFEHDVIDALRAGEVPLVTLWIGTVLIAPVAEEIFFRGMVQNCLANLLGRRWAAVLITGTVFGAIHAGGGDSPQPHVVPALAALGVLLGLLYVRSGSLLAPIVLHALFNAKTLLWETLSR